MLVINSDNDENLFACFSTKFIGMQMDVALYLAEPYSYIHSKSFKCILKIKHVFNAKQFLNEQCSHISLGGYITLPGVLNFKLHFSLIFLQGVIPLDQYIVFFKREFQLFKILSERLSIRLKSGVRNVPARESEVRRWLQLQDSLGYTLSTRAA